MQSLNDFIKDYFKARIAEAERELVNRIAYRQKYYTADCLFDSRKGVVEMIEAEDILGIAVNGEVGEVITAYKNPLLKGSAPQKQRYLLENSGKTWLISEVQSVCFKCDGVPGDTLCVLCSGTGWLDCKAHISK